MTFEDYLQDVHATQAQCLDDEMPDDFNNWLQELDCDEWIRYGELYAKDKQLETVARLEESLKEISHDK